jgi:hypothetical protein
MTLVFVALFVRLFAIMLIVTDCLPCDTRVYAPRETGINIVKNMFTYEKKESNRRRTIERTRETTAASERDRETGQRDAETETNAERNKDNGRRRFHREQVNVRTSIAAIN